MKFDFSKLNYKKLNSYIFLIAMAINFLVSFISYLALDMSFWFAFVIATFFIFVTFYRFNNGIIALIFGEFGVSAFRKGKNKLKQLLNDEQTKELQNTIKYGEKSLITRRKGTNAYYQVIKRENSFYIKKCSQVSVSNLVTDFEKDKNYKGNKNFELMFNAIKDIWYTYDADGELVIYLSNGKRRFHLIPEFPLDDNILEQFLLNKFVKNELFKETSEIELKKINNDNEILFVRNLITAIGIVFTSQSLYLNVPGEFNFWAFVCTIGLLGSLWYYCIMSFLKPQLFHYASYFKREYSKEGCESKQIVMYIVPIICLIVPTVLTLSKFLLISAFIFVIVSIILVPWFIRRNSKKAKNTKIHLITACVLLAFTCVFTTFFLNNLSCKEVSSATYSVVGYSSSRKSHYAHIIVDGKEETVRISYDEYDAQISSVEAYRVSGLFDIEYLI